MILETLAIDPAELERRTGWEIKPEGACKGERCVPLPQLDGQPIDARLLAERLGMRYDKLASSYLAMVTIACIIEWL